MAVAPRSGQRPPLPRLHLVTDRHACAGRALAEVVAAAVRGGLRLVQLRERDWPAAELLAVARALKGLAPALRLVVNDRVDVASVAEADGVQLPEHGLPVAAARQLLGANRLIGRSVHSVAAAREAAREGADYVVLGTIFATSSKPGRVPAGLGLVEEVSRAVTLPVIAIGGIVEENVATVLRAGAYGVAVRAAILGAPDPRAATARLLAAIEREG